jgi:tetratricopeptide (TPR) repeat protein
LWLAALDAQTMLQDDKAIALLARARSTDPRFFPAQYDYLTFLSDRGEFAALRRTFARADPRGGVVTQCMALAVSAHRGAGSGAHPADSAAFSRLASLAPADSSGCVATFLAGILVFRTNEPDSASIAWMWRAVALAPDVEDNWHQLASALCWGPHAAPERAESLLQAATRRAPHVLQRAGLYQHLIGVGAITDSLGARRLTRQLVRALARDGRPMMRVLAIGLIVPYPESSRRTLPLFTAAGDWHHRWANLRGLGKWYVDAGLPGNAIALLDTAVWIADSAHQPWMQLVSRMLRGRAESKIGRTAAAERDLRAAIGLGPAAADPYYLAEAWHNLGHTFEAAGRWPEAAAAMDSFVATTRPMRLDPLRMMSLHDAGTVRWEAGWHAAARRDFSEMVRVVDEQHNNYYWAGEYYERAGDLARALAYYRQALDRVRAGKGLDPNATAGLARVFGALGQDDSAAGAAAEHDSAESVWTPLEHPLLPEVLARRGDAATAGRVAAAWAERQRAGGNVQGAALADLEVATLALGAGEPRRALAAADQADSLAGVLHLVAEHQQAEQQRGTALIALGDGHQGLAALEAAAALARAHPTADAVLSAELALGDGLATVGRPIDALAAYDRAARAVEHVTAGLDIDLDRAGYRDRHLAPFDGAIRALLATPPSGTRTDSLIVWSQRRKAAALALDLQADSIAAPRPASRPALSARLSPGEAAIDYSVSDRGIVAIVLTDRAATVKLLDARIDSITAATGRLTHPFARSYAGRVDLARIPFDLRVARALYDALIRPLEPFLAGRDRLIIVPDGPLHAVPFAALVRDAPARPGDVTTARFLLDDREIRYAPALQFLASSLPVPVARVLVIQGVAPGAAREAAQVRASLPAGRALVLAGSGATESAVRSAAGYTVLHVIAHAEANDADPLASHLRLVADQANDGYLHVSEIAATRWRARLVVLSACETLEGRLYRGEGLMGLARAFLSGGAGSVVSTEWPVGASSADLMGPFYRYLAGGASPAAALRAAQLTLRHNPATRQPFYWAGYVLVAGR